MSIWTAFTLFAIGYLVLVGVVLAWFRSKRFVPRCTRCGSEWKRTERGGEWHLCTPNRRVSL